jgi:death-on-curing protein
VSEWRWIDPSAVIAIHDRQLSEHGGLDGTRDTGAIESALARPRNLAEYGRPDAADLAAAYCYGMVKNHGYADGNKRTGWILARLFLLDNGVKLEFDPVDAVRTVERLAGSELSEADFAAWLRARIVGQAQGGSK